MLKQNQLLSAFYARSPWLVKNLQASAYSFMVCRKKYKNKYHFWRALLKESQYWDLEKLKAFQDELMSKFANYVGLHSPYYHDILGDTTGVFTNGAWRQQMQKFPIINKTIVRQNYSEIIGENINRALMKFTTSGTTGTSLNVFLDSDSYQREYAFRWHFLSVGAATEKSRFAYFVGNNLFPYSKNQPPYHIVDYWQNGIYFSIFHMSDKTLPFYVDAFNNYKPEFVKGYPSGLYNFAMYIKRRGNVLRYPDAVYCASEVLRQYQKDLIEEVFQAPVYQWYGQVETTINIQECEKRRLHVKEEYGYLELINDKGEDAKAGEIASVIGTGWGNKAFPLVRYDTGDNMILAEEQKCPCGRNGRIIEKIVGRDEDVILTPEGRTIGRLDFLFKPISSVKEAQIVQADINTLEIRVVPLGDFRRTEKEKILRKIQEYLGKSFTITIEEVDKLEITKAGKVKYVISKLAEKNSFQ